VDRPRPRGLGLAGPRRHGHAVHRPGPRGDPKDEQDFAAALPVLDAARRRWLAEALAEDHPWRDRLGNPDDLRRP